MQIVRQDEEALVIQSTDVGQAKLLQWLVIAAAVLVSGITAIAMMKSNVWANADATVRWMILPALVIAPIAGAIALCGAIPYSTSFAFERQSRTALRLRKTLLQTSSETFDFDAVQQVVVRFFKRRTRSGDASYWLLYLSLADGRRLNVDRSPASFGNGRLHEIGEAIRDTIGLADPVSEVGPNPGILAGRPAQVLNVVLSLLVIVAVTSAILKLNEARQAVTWPKIEGVVESAKISKKWTSGKHAQLQDSIDIVYRYTVRGTHYWGHRFNPSGNWLSPCEVAEVRQDYAPGHRCQVAYNPANPLRCFLRVDTDVATETLCIAICAAVIVAAVGFAAYNAWKLVTPKPARAGLMTKDEMRMTNQIQMAQ